MHALTCFHAKRSTTIAHTLARDCPNSRLASWIRRLVPEASKVRKLGKPHIELIPSADRLFYRQSERADTGDAMSV